MVKMPVKRSATAKFATKTVEAERNSRNGSRMRTRIRIEFKVTARELNKMLRVVVETPTRY